MSNLIQHAERELQFLRTGDEMNESMADDLIDVVKLFAGQGHSGMSAGYALSILPKLLAFEPVGPLTGEDSEWVEVGDGVFQNVRCGRVFKQADQFDGQAYDIDGIVWEDPDGSRCTNAESRVPVVFPYTPKTEIRKRAVTAVAAEPQP